MNQAVVFPIVPLVPAGRFGLFLRHGRRYPIPESDPYADVSLTPEGTVEAGDLGRAIGPRLVWGASSPFLRCRQTAEALGVEAELDWRLGVPGPWAWDTQEGARAFSELGPRRVVDEQVAGKVLPGFRDGETGLRLILSCATERWERGSGVCVSHDAILMAAMGVLFGASAVREWLATLDGFVVFPVGNRMVARWAGGEVQC